MCHVFNSAETTIKKIYPFSDDLDCNFGQDVGIRHLHGYRIGGVLSSVGMKLENVFFNCEWMEWGITFLLRLLRELLWMCHDGDD